METGPRLAVIADDLTGGLDTGVAFAARGWRTVLRFASQASGVGNHEAGGCQTIAERPATDYSPLTTHHCHAIVWDTETREADEETARRMVRDLCREPAVQAAPRLYKKIDSTLRGPWLAELREVWKARAARTTLLCPAFPAVGRTVVDGEVRVHGRSLAEAGFGGPGRLWELLLERWCGRVVSLSTAQVREAPLADPGREPWLLLADAASDANLDTLVTRLHEQDLDYLLCGAGGLAAAWARVLIPQPHPVSPLSPVAGPVWVLAGSQHAATRAQMQALAAAPGAHVEWVRAGADAASVLRRLPGRLLVGLALLAEGADGARVESPPLITLSFAGWAREFIAFVADAARERGAAAFVATGGETAALLLRALGAGEVEIDRELLPGVPLCRIMDGLCAGTPLVTKAGGFGEPDALLHAVRALKMEITDDEM